MIKVGITGGIGSGKSVVASLLNLYGIPVYVADTESKTLVDTSPLIRENLTVLFGSDIYDGKGLNRKLLASYIFTDPKLREKVNAIIHPEVNRHFAAWVEAQGKEVCAIESAILFESGFNLVVDKVLMVYAPREIRIERATLRDGASREDIIRRIDSQMSDERKKELSDYIIYNDGTQALLPQIQKFITALWG